MTFSRLLGASALAGTLFIHANAWAQTAPPTQTLPDSGALSPSAVPNATTPDAQVTPDGLRINSDGSTQRIAQTNDEGVATTEPLQDQAGRTTDIVVTGSRIPVRNTIDAAVPITAVTATELLGSRGDISLGDAISQLPQLRSSFTQANSIGSIGTAGINALDLRGLGTARTLTLLNGRRIVTSQPGQYTPDINTIPFDLVERIDTVTGGNSAIYGSDAVAGVVNITTRREYDGARFRVQGGATTYGDRGSYLASGMVGKTILDGRLNITAAGEYSHSEPLFYADREYLGAFTGNPGFITSQITTAPNRNFDGIPNAVFVNGGIKFTNISTGGLVQTSCPAATATNAARRAAVCTGQNNPLGTPLAYFYVFQPDGTLVRNDPSQGLVDNRGIGGGVLGGLTATGLEDAMLLPGVDRYLGSIFMTGNFSAGFKPFAEFSFARIDASQQSTQPTFTGGQLSRTVSINNPFLTAQSRQTLATILAPGATSFGLDRFNNDFGTRAEFHRRDTYRGVVGVGGNITDKIRYEVAGNYGRTDNFYRTGGNVLIQNYNNAFNAVAAPAGYTGTNFATTPSGGRAVCAINADASTANDDPNCVPLNLFGRANYDQRALNYVLYTSTRKQWAEQIDATAFIAGDTGGFFRLPGGPIGFSIGGEYRREDANSTQDPITQSGATFLNPASTFSPPAVEVKEAYGEIRLPLLSDVFGIHELTAEGAGRISDYGGRIGSVTAWNAGLIWAPVRDLRFRGTYSRSIRAPNLSNLYASRAITYATISDPCDQPGGSNATNNIDSNPNRRRNCAAAGIPTTLTFTNPDGVVTTRPWTNVPGSTPAGVNQGNQDLEPEVGYSFTVGGAFTPTFLPGFKLTVDYYNIRVKNVISGLTGQTIINRCYDDPVGIDNVFCSAVFRRTSTDAVQNGAFNGQNSRNIEGTNYTFTTAGDGISFLNQPFNFAKLETKGIDVDVSYAHTFSEDFGLNVRGLASYLITRRSFYYISEPSRYDRINDTLGDPSWQAQATINARFRNFDINYNARYIGKQIVSALSYDTFFSVQGRPPLNPDARPFKYYDPIVYHNVRLNLNATKQFSFYLGVDNLTNELPPYDQTGNGDGAIYPNTGRFLYAGATARF